jgi:hypothetical protein
MSNKSKNMQLTLMLPPELVAQIDWSGHGLPQAMAWKGLIRWPRAST